MVRSIFLTNVTGKAKDKKLIDYILAIPAAVTVQAFINTFKGTNLFYKTGVFEVSVLAGYITLDKTSDVICAYRKFFIDIIKEVNDGNC